jgi:Raf kinase inhibitor-like YbhB/YbcL family protein
MPEKLTVTIAEWADGAPIPGEFAFAVPADDGPMTLGPNRSPEIAWSGAPAGTKSFTIICHDPDVPSVADDVNKEGAIIPANLPRVDFYHWVLVDIPASVTGLPAGADSDGVTLKGKPAGATPNGVRGINSYTDFLAGNEDMGGDYGGYDGPCPPWNDELLHHYIFTVYALDVASLDLPARFGGGDALSAMDGHVLASGQWTGTYTLNPAVK